MLNLLMRLGLFVLCGVFAATGLGRWAMGSLQDGGGMMLFAGLAALLVLGVGTFIQHARGPRGE